jgi:hydrogenase maturation protease
VKSSGGVAVLGIGNLVHADDGVGIHAIGVLRLDPRVPQGVVLVDGGTQGLSLLPHIAGFSRLLVVDAVDAGQPAGSLMCFKGKSLDGLPGKPSVHQLGFADLMSAMFLMGDSPEEVVVLGVQPLSTAWVAELTAPVRDALHPLVDAVIAQLAIWSTQLMSADERIGFRRSSDNCSTESFRSLAAPPRTQKLCLPSGSGSIVTTSC